MQAIFETLFDIVYLVSVITLGILMIRGSKGRKQYFLYGIMAVVPFIWYPGRSPCAPQVLVIVRQR